VILQMEREQMMQLEKTIYKTDISDARWMAYDIPGNIGWMTYLAMLAKMIRDREYGTAAQRI